MRALTAAFALALVLVSTTANAQMSGPAPSEPAPANTVGTTVNTNANTAGPTIWGILGGWYGGVGVGGRYMIPLGIKPLITNGNLKDSFALEVGADFMTWSYSVLGGYRWNQILPVAGIMWNIWIDEKLAFYPKLDLGYGFGWFSGWDNAGPQPTYGGFFWNIALGGLYKVSGNVALRGEIGYAGLKLGAQFLF
jgi:hypothetical protein